MIITSITVSYGETQSLPEYSNVKPAVTLTAELDADDDAAAVEAALWEQAKQSVHAQIDSALELNGKPAKYDPCPRFQVVKTYHDRYADRGKPAPPKLVIILPDALEMERELLGARLVHAGYPESRKLRYAHAMQIATEALDKYAGATLLDCADGDMSRLQQALEFVAEADVDAEL